MVVMEGGGGGMGERRDRVERHRDAPSCQSQPASVMIRHHCVLTGVFLLSLMSLFLVHVKEVQVRKVEMTMK